MIIVFADDFSGAAEIGGIAHSIGLEVQIQKQFMVDSSLDIIIIDMDSRALNIKSAFEKVKSISDKVYMAYPNARFFKKVDSTLRGQIVSELEAHLNAIPFESILLLPNNPTSGRMIRNGKYYIQSTPLHKTQLASDPDFPRYSNTINTLFEWKDVSFPYTHLHIGKKAPQKPFICTADISATKDINDRLKRINTKDLVCGSGETFRAFVNHLGIAQKPIKLENEVCEYTVLINGSTVKNKIEKNFLDENKIPTFILPAKETDLEEWVLDLFKVMKTHKFIAIYPDAKPKQNSKWILSQLSKIMTFLFKHLRNKSLQLLMTGGATATAVLEASGSGQYQIIKEEASGVVTSKDAQNEHIKMTTKPGSYPWETAFLNQLYDKK